MKTTDGIDVYFDVYKTTDNQIALILAVRNNNEQPAHMDSLNGSIITWNVKDNEDRHYSSGPMTLQVPTRVTVEAGETQVFNKVVETPTTAREKISNTTLLEEYELITDPVEMEKKRPETDDYVFEPAVNPEWGRSLTGSAKFKINSESIAKTQKFKPNNLQEQKFNQVTPDWVTE